jgi:hypothetical protein
MKYFLTFFMFWALLTELAFAGDPNVFYYVSDGTNELYSINRVTGTRVLIGATTGATSIEAIAFYPIPGANQLFAANGGDFGTLALTGGSAGAFTSIGQIDGGGTANGSSGPQSLDDVDGLMLDGQTFKMWAIERKSGVTPDLLFQIDITTGLFVANAFGSGIDYLVILGSGIDVDVDDLAVNPLTGKLYATSNDNGASDILLEINKFTGVFTFITTLSEDDVEGLAFSNNGQLYGAEGDGDNRLGEINLTTGVLSNFSSFTGSDVEALASLVANANTVSGSVYDDVNFNGVNDAEAGIANVSVYLYNDINNNGRVDPEDTRVQSTSTDVNGDYSFFYASTGNLLTSTKFSSYPASFALTTDNVEAISFTDGVNFDETDANKDFGLATGPDCDGEGIPDFFEGAIDSDGDGVANECDLDSDNDGIRDDAEGIEDFDDDGIPDYLDRDSDDDGIPDAIEANAGIQPSGYNAVNGNIDGAVGVNGIVDAIETASESGIMIALNPDSDGDGRKDYLDLDSDNDGILDLLEAGGVDVDGDGQVDGVTDLNNNGYSDLLETTGLVIPNTDAGFEGFAGLTLLPDYIDIDSDSDGIDDTREGLSTANYRFPTLVIDSDDDGIIDFWDVSTFSTPITPNDRDGDGTPDYQDFDSDNDGVTDVIEGNDVNADGVADVTLTGIDANQNGLDDAFDGDCGNSAFSTGGDYGEETFSDGSMYITSSDLEFVTDDFNGGRQIVGLYFPNVNVGQGEPVNSTYIQFETDEAETGAVTITINGELIANAPAFTTANSNISARTLTARSETWSPADWNTVGEIGLNQRTVDIKLIIQEIVNQGTWVRGNDIAIIFSGPTGNTRTAEVNPIITIVVNNGICGSNVAVQDFDGDGERDWRDTDDDEDGIATISEIPDADVSGTPDYIEFDGDGCSNGFTSSGTTSTNNGALQSESGVDRDERILGAPNNSEAEFESNNDEYVMDFNQTYNVGVQYVVRWRKQDSGGDPAVIVLSESADNITFTDVSSFPTTASTGLIDETITSALSFRYLRFRLEDASSNDDFEIDAITVLEPICEADNDNDGITDAIDIDDDNDGVLDVDENSGCIGPLTGTLQYEFYDVSPAGGTVNNIPTSGADGVGSVTEFDVDALYALVTPGDGDNFSIRYTGYILISIADTYTFYTSSDDGSNLSIDGVEIVDNDGAHGTQERSGSVALTEGLHSIEVLFFENGGDEFLSVSYQSSTIAKAFLPFSILSETNTCDSDGDGIANQFDLDSDNDGIADIIEAGGVDADNNGRVDAYADGDADGWADTFDSNNGGTALADADTDGDGLENRIDIDADNDGIVDVIEAQLSGASPSLPSGVDSDADGTDDNFDSDSGSSFLVPINTDATDTPDYIDTNSDNDGDLDILEGWDTDNDGTADTSPAGTDTDNDGLDDNFDAVSGINSGLNVSNNGQTSESFPDNDNSSTPERDWREFSDNDKDSDGIVDDIDIDDDNDGILDADEAPCAAPSIRFKADPDAYWTLDNTTDDATANNNDERSDGNAPGFSTDAIQGTHSANFNGISNQIRYSQDGGFMESTYTDVSFSAWIRPTALVGDRVIYEEGGGTNGLILWLDDGLLTYTARNGGAGSETSVSVDVSRTLGIDNLWHHVAATFEAGVMTVYLDGISETVTAGFIQISSHSSDGGLGGSHGGTPNGVTGNFAGLMDAARYSNTEAWPASRIGFEAQRFCDTDNDGVADHLDLDSDNDGIADIIEAGGVDVDGDGRVDGVFNDGNNTDGWSNIFDDQDGSGGTPLADEDQDGEGILNRVDLDSDNDGLQDILEAGGVDSDGNGMVDDITDTDNDGLADTFDSDDGGTALPVPDTDGDGTLPNYLDVDSDNDGIIDNIEWQTTANFNVLSNVDANNNGWDDEYDGNVEAISNVDVAADAIPDYLDLNTDDDTQPDWLERADDDEDGDALLDLISIPDAYELANGNPNQYVSSDDADSDGIPDFLEDANSDGVPNFLDPGNVMYYFDTDNDGLVDLYDADQNGDNRDHVSEMGEADNDGSPDFRDGDNEVSLPIELISFVASKVGAYVQLDWSTATEINNDYFTVERSQDGQTFEEILTEKGAGNSSRRLDYRRYDESPELGHNYYRLSQTDFNGAREIFNVEVVKFDGSTLFDNEPSVEMMVYPNPTDGSLLTLSIEKVRAGKVTLKIMTGKGRLISKQQLNVYSETTNFQVEILEGKKLAAGTYYLRVITQDKAEVIPFIVR